MTLSLPRDEFRSSLPKTKAEPPVSDQEMEQAVRTLLLGLGEDPDREGLIDTPKRVVKALKFLTSGYHQSLDDLLNGAVFHEKTNEMVLVRDIDLFSEDGGIFYRADADAQIPKGLVGLLIEGFNGITPEEVAQLSPEFIQRTGLNVSLTPSRSNGFYNIFKTMQLRAIAIASSL